MLDFIFFFFFLIQADFYGVEAEKCWEHINTTRSIPQNCAVKETLQSNYHSYARNMCLNYSSRYLGVSSQILSITVVLFITLV